MKYLAIWLFVFGLILIITAPANANHNTYLPLVPQTPLMQQVIKNQTYTYCTDTRATNYPNFVSQLRDVTDRYTERTGIRWQQVPFDSSCMVRHVMPDGITCSGWAAQIFYANWPVTVQYCWTLGYTDWRSAHGHELGHGLLGLHEQYVDSGGSIGCSGRQDTVMDCGSGVRYPTPLDVSRGCAIIRTAWCGTNGFITQEPVCTGPGDPYWNPCVGRWVFSDGWSVDPATGVWWNPTGQPEWSGCNADGLRWNFTILAWVPPPSAFFQPSRNFWVSAGAC